MGKEENIEFLESALEKAKNSNEEDKVITNEQVWNSLKRNILNISSEFDTCFTEEDTKRIASKSDSFNKFATNVIKGIADDYNEQHRERELNLRDEDIKVRKAHEINEAIRLTQTNPEAGQAIISGMMSLLGSNMSVPRELNVKKPAKAITVNKEIVADVSFDEE